MACFGVAGLRMAGSRVRTPVRKALLAGAVTKETYGRAFGFERPQSGFSFSRLLVPPTMINTASSGSAWYFLIIKYE